MTAIRYDIIPGDYYCSKKGAISHLHGFPDGVLNADGDPKLKEHCDKNLVNYGFECENTGKFLWNGITYYASAKTLQQIEKKFGIKDVFTDKDLRKKAQEKEDKMKSLMRSDEWLENKVLEDSAKLFESGLKRNAFVQKIREENIDIAHSRMTRQTQKLFNEEYWSVGAQGKIIAGPKFPKDKLTQGPKIVEVKDMYGRVKEQVIEE